ncbi:ALF repeat-containing protein [Streptomyces luomodiensis]|uniref:ALF repeat-containing protein n=1 Tax=Streptomyces luomodiensis TaxID=3026192 RepID=A0ABY9UNA0_9ACTN|nr:ALF repeat-containing protein [Streptomyces sp. SCA4-21]WNE94024.1 ALF repeat-containing protein [Streptomyces sp. SCA4-21]
MRPMRAALLVVATALTPALLFTAPAFASDSAASATTTAVAATSGTPVDEMSEDELRAAIADILADEDSGKGVIREANEALNGTVDDMRTFLKTGYRLAQAEDDRVAIAHILYVATQNNDKRVIEEANKLLDSNSPEEMRAWLETGYRLAQAEDDAVYIVRMLADPNISDALRAAVNAALDDGSPETLRYFREVGQYEVDG